jgi:Cation efflux family
MRSGYLESERDGEWDDRSSMTPPITRENGGHSADGSLRTVLVDLVAGLGVALAKAGASVFTGSSALAAEASHSLGDTANDLFLLVAQRRSSRPASERHPLGHGREAYFWALIAACGATRALIMSRRLWIVARVEIDEDFGCAQVTSLVRGVESGMRCESEHIYRVDIVPVDGGQDGIPR